MKRLMSLAIVMGLFLVGSAIAEELNSGLKAGAPIGAFHVTKCAGAEDDGIKVGQKTCYRCNNGARPQVMVFTRSGADKVVKLVKKIDECVQKNEESQLRSFVNMLGESRDAAAGQVKKLAVASKAKQIPFVVPNDFENGPEDYRIDPKAAITIIFANESKVVASYSVSSIKDLDVAAALKNVKKILD